MKEGKYDFTLSEYLSNKNAYIKTWKKYPVKRKVKPNKVEALKTSSLKVDSLKADSLKKDSLLKKELRK